MLPIIQTSCWNTDEKKEQNQLDFWNEGLYKVGLKLKEEFNNPFLSLSPIKITPNDNDKPFSESKPTNNFENKIFNSLHQYDSKQNIPSSELSDYIKTNANKTNQNQERINTEVNMINSWSNIFSTNHELSYLFLIPSGIKKTGELTVNIDKFGFGSVLGMLRYATLDNLEQDYYFVVGFLTTKSVSQALSKNINKVLDCYPHRIGFTYNHLFVNWEKQTDCKTTTFNNVKSKIYYESPDNDLAIIRYVMFSEDRPMYDVELNNMMEYSPLKNYLNTIVPIFGVDLMFDRENALNYTALKKDSGSDLSRTLFVNPFRIRNNIKISPVPNTLTASLLDSVLSIVGSGTYFLMRNEQGSIVKILNGVVGDQYLSTSDQDKFASSRESNNLNFDFVVDNNFVELSYINTNLVSLKGVRSKIRADYNKHLEDVLLYAIKGDISR
ncbi:hypothetical protein [Mycoplasmoides gallisepticum]|uniref:hypothetical protein n=1 Tax=Mycoplasmoides gallisepticum TaxID=2096 RepID=UPI0037049117